jgi:hypothetical protein
MRANPLKVAIVFGLFLGLWHACWAALVAIGIAQRLLDFVFWMHFIAPPYHVEPFALARAGILVAVTFGVGLLGGFIGALIWNALHRASA